MQSIELRTRYFDFGHLFLVPITLSSTKALFSIELMEEIKLLSAFNHYNLQITP